MNRTKQAAMQRKRDSGDVRPATVMEFEHETNRLLVRVSSPDSGRTKSVFARLALATAYQPSAGDRVLVAGSGDELYVIGILCASSPPSLPLPDGGSASVRDGALEVRDPAGRLVVRYAGGSAEIAAPEGDVTLSAPHGRIVLRSGKAIEMDAGGEVTSKIRISPEQTRVEVDRLDIHARESHLESAQATVLAQRITTTAVVLKQEVERFELTATRIVERARDAFHDVSDLVQTRTGRVRTIVKGAYTLLSRRTSMNSTEDTSIDGSKVLLG